MKRLILSTVLFLLIAGLASAQTTYELNPGAPLGQYVYRGVSISGTPFYVDSTDSAATDSTSYGYHPDYPFATIDYAISQCTASAGDIIYVAPGHVEELGSAETIDVDVIGVTIIGQSDGTLRPRIDFNAADSSFDIGADDVVIKGLTFRPGITSTLIGIDVESGANNVTIEDCEFMIGEAAGTDEFVVAIDLKNDNDNSIIRNNRFYTDITDASCTEAIMLTASSDGISIVNNIFYGNWSASVIGDAAASTNVLIADNVMKVKDGEPCIEMTSSTTGQAVGNMCSSSGVTCSVSIVAADMEWFLNECVTTDGAASVEIGGTSTASLAATLALVGATVDQIETDVGTLQTENTLIGATVDDIETKVDTANTNINSGNTTLATVNTNVNSGNTLLSTVNTNVNSGNTTLGTLNTNINSGNTLLTKLPIYVTCTVLQSDIVAAGVNLTGAVTGGAAWLRSVNVQNGATAWDSSGDGAVFEMYSTNLDGNASFMVTAEATLGANIVMDLETAGTTSIQVAIESTKLVKLKGTTEDFTSDGLTTIYLEFMPLTSGVTIATGTGCQ